MVKDKVTGEVEPTEEVAAPEVVREYTQVELMAAQRGEGE